MSSDGKKARLDALFSELVNDRGYRRLPGHAYAMLTGLAAAGMHGAISLFWLSDRRSVGISAGVVDGAATLEPRVSREDKYEPRRPARSHDSLDAPPGVCPKYASARSVRNSATSQQSLDRGYEVLRRCRLGHVRGVVGCPVIFSGAVPFVQHVWDALLFEAIAELRNLAFAQRMIQDHGRRSVVFYGNERLGN